MRNISFRLIKPLEVICHVGVYDMTDVNKQKIVDTSDE